MVASIFDVQASGKYFKDFPLRIEFSQERVRQSFEQRRKIQMLNGILSPKLGWDIYTIMTHLYKN